MHFNYKVGSSSNFCRFCFEHAQFASWHGCDLSWLRHFLIFLSPSRQKPGQNLKLHHEHIFPCTVQLIVHYCPNFLIFVVPCIMLYSGEMSPTRCNNWVFYSRWLYSTCFGWQSHPSSGVQCCIWPQVSWLT